LNGGRYVITSKWLIKITCMEHFSLSKTTFKYLITILTIIILFISVKNVDAQRIYASSQKTGSSSILCLNCTVTNPANAADGNLQTASILNVGVGVAASTYQELVFAAKPAAGIPVTVKLGSGDKLLSLTALGGVTLQAYNGTTAIGKPVAASTLLTALSNNNQTELSITPQQNYDRIRITLVGGLAAVLGNLYVYEAFYNGNAPAACTTAIDELHGISAGLLNLGVDVGGVANPQLAIDGNINTASTLNAGVSAVGAFAQQTIIYNNPSVIGDSIRLTLSVPAALLTAGVLSNISVATYNGNTSNNDQVAISAPLLTIRLLDLTNNRQRFVVTFVPAKVFDRVQLTLGGIANVLATLNLYEAQRLIARPIIKVNNVVTTNAQTCTGSPVTLTATAVPNTTFNWYSAATGGTPVFTGAAFTTPALTATTTYYVAAMRTGCTDESERTSITVTVNAIPAVPVVTNSNISICSGQTATFTASTVAGITINWYSAATGGTLLHTGNTYTTGALTATTNFYAEAVSGGTCTSPTRKLVTATITPPPAVPTVASANVSVCDGSVASLAVSNPQTGVTYNWYRTITGGTSLFTGTNFTTPVLHSTTSYYVEASNAGGCTSTQRTLATATVVPAPATPTLAANNATVSAGQTATIAVTNTQTGVTYNWYTSPTATASVFTGSPYKTPALFATTTFYVAATNSTGCTSATRTPITITVITGVAPCTFASQQSVAVNGVCIGCSVANAPLATDADTTTASTINVLAGLLGGTAQQSLIFQQPGLAGDTVKLVLQNPAGLLNASLLGQITVTFFNGALQGTSYSLNSALLRLNLLPGTSNKYAVYLPATAAYDRVVVSVNGVATVLTSLNIYYAMQQFPKPVFNPVAPEVCKGSTAVINITSPTNGTFAWFTTPTGGVAVHTGTSFTTPALTANTTYYIEYTRGTCTGATRFPVQVLVDDVPAAPVITTQNVTVNSGQTALLNATATNGATVQWFTAASGGTPIATGNTFTTPALTANTTYYAGAAAGSCVSVTRVPVTVTVKPLVIPNVSVTPATISVNPGQTTNFTATSTTPGAIFNWFTTPKGGTSIFTGATYTTPPEFANNIYYAEASVPATGAVSATRASGTVTVAQSGVNPVNCDAAIDQTNTTSGLLCVGCGISNPTGSVDADRNTFSQLSVPIGLVNSYAQQTLRFANTASAGDSVVIELGYPGALASVGVLSQISIATYNGTTFNNDRFNVNSALIKVTLLNGTSRFTIAFKAAHDFDRVEVRLNAALAGVFNSLNIYDATQEVSAPVIGTTPTTVCQGSQATIVATAQANVTVKWYASATGGTALFTGTTFTTPVLNATTTYYAEASRTADGCTQAVRTPVTITVTPIPAAPVVAAANITVCSGSPATFNVQPVTGVTYNWFAAATGGTSLHTGNSFTSPALTATTAYYVEAEGSGSCSSSQRTKVTATVTNTPADAMVTPASVQTCSGTSATLVATSTQPGVTFNWYTAATGGTLIFTGPQFTTPALTANTSYWVEVASGSCISLDRTRADVIVNPVPASPTVNIVPAGGQINSGQTAKLTASSTTAGVIFNWYTGANGGTPIFTGATFTTPALSSNTTYYVEAASGTTGCISAQRTPVTIKVISTFSTSCDFASTQTTSNSGVLCVGCTVLNPDNAVDTDTTNFSQLNLPIGLAGFQAQQLIFGDAGSAGDTVTMKIGLPVSLATVGVLNDLQIASFNGATYNGDRINLSSSLIKIQILSGGQTAIIKFVPGAAFTAVEIRLAGTLSLFNTLNIYYATKQVATPQINVKTVNICAGDKATFTVNNPAADVTYKWYSAAVGGTLMGTGNPFTTAALTATTTYYAEASRTANGCANPNRVAVTANVTPLPVPPVLAQNAVQICAGDQVTLAVTNANGAPVTWYDAPTGGTLLFTGASFTVSPIATIKYYAELSNGTCSSAARTVATVTVNPRPAAPAVQSANVQVCAGSPAVLQVLNPATGVNYDWYTAATGGTLAFTGAQFTTPAITQTTTYYVQATNAVSGCSNNGGRTAVNITTTNQVNAPVLSATSTTVCSGGSASISVVNPVAGLQYSWFTAATGGAAVFTGTTFTVNNLTANTAYFVEAANSTGCVSATRTETDVTVQPVPTPPQVQAAAGSLGVCQGSSATLSIVNPQVDFVYRWYDAATNGTLLFTGTQFDTPPINSTTTYYVEASQAGNCNASARTQVTVTVNALPADPVLANAITNVCAGSPATLTISAPQTGVTYQWFDSPGQTNKLFEGTTYITGPITVNTVFYVAAVNASGCQSTNLATAQVNIAAPPDAPLLAGGDTVQTCSGSAAVLAIANPQPGFTYNWYAAAAGGTPLFTGTSFTTPALSATTDYFVEAVNATGCTSASRTDVTINVNPLPVAPTVTAQGGSTNIATCQGNTITLTANSTTANVTFNWYNQASGGTPLFTGATFTTPAITATTTFYVEAVSNAGNCTSATRTAVQVLVVPQPQTPMVSSANVSVCNGSTATLSVQSPQAGLTYNWYDSATKTNLLFTGPTYTTAALTANATYYVDANNGSCSSSSVASVQVTLAAPPSAPALVNASPSACNGSQVTLQISNPQTGFIYNWYTDATGGSLIATGTSFTTGVLNGNTSYYAEAVNSTGCASASRTAANITATPLPDAPQITAPPAAICPGSSATLVVANAGADITVNWYAAATGGTPLFSGSNVATPALDVTTVYYAEAQNGGGCISASRTAVTVNVITPPDAPTVTVSATTASTITFTWDAVNGATSYEFSLNNGATFTAADGMSYTVTNLQPLQSATIIVKALGVSACQLSTNSAAVTGTTTNPIGNQVFIPNAFSPNGDGNNDIFRVFGNTLKNVSMWVYDQWGNMLFNSNNQSAGWDGTFKGKAQPVGVYVYYVEATLENGEIVKRKGTINLLR
jgi:gliding motility-associated-like protein